MLQMFCRNKQNGFALKDMAVQVVTVVSSVTCQSRLFSVWFNYDWVII